MKLYEEYKAKVKNIVENPIKDLSIKYAEQIYDEVIETKVENTKKDLKRLLMSFLKNCEIQMKNTLHDKTTTNDKNEPVSTRYSCCTQPRSLFSIPSHSHASDRL